jgi:hypothetical protein
MVYSREARQAELESIVDNAQHVAIDYERLALIAAVMEQELRASRPFQTDPRSYPKETLPENDRDTMQFYFVLTSQHFCIWRRAAAGVEAWDIEIDGQRYVGGRGVNAALIRALAQGRNILDPAYLASMTLADVKELYRDERTGDADLQLLSQRLAKLNEVGRVLLERYQGHVAHLLEETGGRLFSDDGRGLVQQLTLHFPVSYFDWPFTKLATLYGKYLSIRNVPGIPTTTEYRALTEIKDYDHFEVAADYYIPLFFIRTGIFRISDAFAGRLLKQQLIDPNSRMEREFRAATMIAGRALAERIDAPLLAVDEELWSTGYMRCRRCRSGISDKELPCPYRGLSTGYQSDELLMKMRWPLVLTPCY